MKIQVFLPTLVSILSLAAASELYALPLRASHRSFSGRSAASQHLHLRRGLPLTRRQPTFDSPPLPCMGRCRPLETDRDIVSMDEPALQRLRERPYTRDELFDLKRWAHAVVSAGPFHQDFLTYADARWRARTRADMTAIERAATIHLERRPNSQLSPFEVSEWKRAAGSIHDTASDALIIQERTPSIGSQNKMPVSVSGFHIPPVSRAATASAPARERASFLTTSLRRVRPESMPVPIHGFHVLPPQHQVSPSTEGGLRNSLQKNSPDPDHGIDVFASPMSPS